MAGSRKRSKHFRVVLPDQRGTGRSSRVDTHVIEGMDGDGKAGAAFLKRFLADSIVRDFEHLRRTEFGGRTLGSRLVKAMADS